ncbi:MAG: ferrous iron transport protein B [Lachnospiraceae bacterium]|jgi:ferrous iron transport protein B|nr:ferrous iron transport protein B [Lachnospiraceae bacterium]MCI8871889.1 ferrous iron transport protein B [Lachnospiraceae bacterium]GFI31039.1 Fe(2+) transporter FeoB [Lachnospiraceae bacterium]
MEVIRVGFVGNPNCGKTTLFNAYTGANLKVANWPGVTVEKVEGETSYKGQKLKLIDLPGIYSLTSYSIEEKVSRRCIMKHEVDVIVNVVDASALERNLYLTMQLLELGKPVILALNMMDIVEERGMEIDLHRLPEMLGGIPVVPVSARKRNGLDVLLHAVVHHYEEKHRPEIVTYQPMIEEKIRLLEPELKQKYQILENPRWYALKLLERDSEIEELYPLELPEVLDRSYEKDIINQKYDYIEEVLEDTLFYKSEKAAFTDRVDEILTHPIWGMPIFFGIMAVVFFLTFFVGDALKGGFEVILDTAANGVLHLMESIHVADWMISLVVDGILAGVGGILTFLPNIFILFLALAMLEDSGYMARVAYVMDGLMGHLGLSGKAFLPMVLGFGCTVPAVMATRALEKESDRRRTILITPFMSCSARLPIYVLFADMFFGKYAMFAALSMYFIGMAVAIIAALVIHRVETHRSHHTLLIELPEYKTPNARTIAIYVWEKVKGYLTKAGTTIFIASIIIWFLLNFGIHGMVTEVSESFGAILGHWMEPILAPAGLGMWQIGVALISGISAKEVVVSSFCVLFGISNVNSASGMTALLGRLAEVGFGPLNAYSMMIFCLLYVPCAATIGTIKKETGSVKFTLKMLIFQMVLAWLAAVLTYQIGSLLG